MDLSFTANMESLLDKVADGSVAWKTVVRNFYPDLDEAVNEAEKQLETVKIEDEVTDEICDQCAPPHGLSSMGPTASFWPAPVSRSVRIQSPTWKRSACPAPSAEARWCGRNQEGPALLWVRE